MIPVIFDCDNTMGIYGKDVDDGLALLYLLGSEKINLKAITTTFGNSTLNLVHPNMIRILKELNRTDIPLYKGAESCQNRHSEAAQALVDLVNASPHQITILATGSLTNLKGAYDIDPLFFSKVKRLVLMGGIEYPLLVNGIPMKELNFASDPLAASTIIQNCHTTSIITGHVCLDAVFSNSTYIDMAKTMDHKTYSFIVKETKAWISYIGKLYQMDGFCNWDAVAAVYIDNPHLFDSKTCIIGHNVNDLKMGLLTKDETRGTSIDIPVKIKDIAEFNTLLIQTWSNVHF